MEYRLLESKKTRFTRNGDGTYTVNTKGNCYKVTTMITPGGEFLDGKRFMTTLQEISISEFPSACSGEKTTQKH
jgi:hypothetical protein